MKNIIAYFLRSVGSDRSAGSIVLVIAVVGVTMFACKSSTDSSSNPTGSDTTYSYVGKDSAGAVFVTGTFTIPGPIDTAHPTQKGTWALNASAGVYTPNFGPQFGTGTWLGGFLGLGHVTAVLKPFIAGKSVSLDGTLAGTVYSGRWAYTLSGVEVNHGTYVATLQ